MTGSPDAARVEPAPDAERNESTARNGPRLDAATALGAVVLGGFVTAVVRPVALRRVETVARRRLRSIDALFSSPC